MIGEELVINDKYEALFKIPEARLVLQGKSNAITNIEAEALAAVDIVIVTGGRNSAKSFTVAAADAYWTENYNYRTLFTRYTLDSAEDTIIPDFMEKVDLLGYRNNFKIKKDRVTHVLKTAKVVFKGIKTSAGNQTGKLKSLKNFNIFILDEGEEMHSYEDWQKIYLSMRASDVQNLSIIVMNPSDEDHFVFQKFFKERDVDPFFNGIKGNILYIHTTYLDLEERFVPRNIRVEFERMRVDDPDEYDCIVLGKWRKNIKGALFKREELQYFEMDDLYDEEGIVKNVKRKVAWIDVAGDGSDNLSMPIGYQIGAYIYVVDWYFTKDGTEITIPMCAEYARIHNLHYLGIETNSAGAIFSKDIIDILPANTEVMEVYQTSNKHGRILNNSGSIKMKVMFRSDYEPNSMYDIAMREFFKYNRVKTENMKRKSNDDAPDSIAGLKLLCDDLKES